MSLRRALLLSLFLASPSAYAADAKPDWLSGQSAQYPKSAYIIGVGQAENRDKAADRARAELAKVFSVNVEATGRSYMESVSDGRAESSSQFASDEVKSSTRKVLDGVEVPDYWEDGQGGVYALAVLDRVHSLKVFKDKLDEMDKDFAEARERMDKADGKFGKLKLALKLMRLAKTRRRVNADYRILNPDGTGLPAPEGQSEALGLARKAIAAVTVSVEAAGDEAGRAASRIIDGLSAYGLKVVERSDNPADVVVEAKTSADPLPSDNLTWYWARGSILVKMSYGSTGEVFTRFEEAGQDAARDPSSSVGVVLASLSDKTAGHVFKVLTSNDVLDD